MIDFLKYRVVFAIFSVLLIGSFFADYYYKVYTRGYAFSYSVDFTGGTQVLFRFSQPVTDNQLKEILEKHGHSGPVMRDFSAQEILVRVKEVTADVKDFAEKLRSTIEQNLQSTTVSILSVDSVSGGVGAVLRWKSLQAILIALILMLFYIWFRFWSISFGVGALVSLAHDAIVILQVFLLLDKEISINMIGAVLTILGYSINDTIIVFTRIRQNMRTMKDAPMVDIVNLSINQTMRRTILTSFATLLVVISLMLLGGEALRDLSLALFIGIVFGTYSSIYIASSVMVLLHKRS